jgi:hypothetical protein
MTTITPTAKNICINLSKIPGFNDLLNENSNDENSNVLKLNKVDFVTKNNQKYKIIRYDKNFLNFDNTITYGLCRSVIVNSENKVVCYSPSKSIHSDAFIKKYDSNNGSIVAQEFVEGTMINVFWDSTIGLTGGWEIATRNTIGAKTCFYKNKYNKTFRDMFLEAAGYNGLNIELLNKTYCYSFVLQHPENRIVVPFSYPILYLIAVYSIDNVYSINNTDKDNIIVNIVVNIIDMEFIKSSQHFKSTSVQFPKNYEYKTYSELIEKYASMNTNYDVLGFVLYNRETGERTKVRNPVYEYVRSLRGNQAKTQYQYLCLRRENKVAEFLKFYPDHKKQFSQFRDQIHLFTDTLLSNYQSCYIRKEKPLGEFPSQYRTHMYNIHQLYMNELKPKKLYVSRSIVIEYVNDIHPSLLMFCLNFHLRKRVVDFIKSESQV